MVLKYVMFEIQYYNPLTEANLEHFVGMSTLGINTYMS